MRYILIATKNQDAQEVIRNCFDMEYRVEIALEISSCLEMFQKKRYECLFLDIEFITDNKTENDFKKHLQSFWRVFPESEIIILTRQEMLREAVRAVKAGASNYLTYPLVPTEVKYIIESVWKSTKFEAELKYLRNKFWRRESFDILRTDSPVMKDVFEKVRAVAQTDTTVLITGETGTGKGVIAKLVHTHSGRGEKQFINVHCGAIPDTLLESELFGHEKGAFTGAISRKLGKFEIAHEGTIFLDEIGTISSAMQVKLLEVLQDKSYHRLGGETSMQADVRVITATNADLIKMCEEGTFRKDLFYRLHVYPIEIPSLRDRREDIHLLVKVFLERLNRFSTKNIIDIDQDVLKVLQTYAWPGNIRELENLIERAYILETGSFLTCESFPSELFADKNNFTEQLINTTLSLEKVRRNAIEQVERQYLSELLTQYHGKIGNTAKAAGIGVRQLHKLMTKYHLCKEKYKENPIYPSDSES